MRRRGRAFLGVLAALAGLGCLGPVQPVEGGYRHRKHDFRIAAPGPGWKRIDVEGAALAFQRPGPDTMSLLSRCGRPVAEAQLMARHLTFGAPERSFLASAPVAVAGRGGWTQTFEVEREGVPVRIKTVTLVVSDCTFDWILAAAGPFEPAQSEFDAWWASFELGARYEEAQG